MLVGVDNFKEINEKYGAKTGDEVLNILTDSIKKYIDTPLRIFRMPGDIVKNISYFLISIALSIRFLILL